jgi:eukaryotic-like serine/threonine-protein kinase
MRESAGAVPREAARAAASPPMRPSLLRIVVPEPLPPGHVLHERYAVRKLLARGGMGSIYLAEDQRLPGRQCAVKEVEHDPGLPEGLRAEAREQFFREASVLARLDHPNLPKVSDYFSTQLRDYLIMDYVPGPDLKSIVDQASGADTRLPIADILHWADQILDALGYMHGQDPPVIHRDIKPSNLKLTPAGLIKLVDFGLVKTMAPDDMTVTVIQGRGTALYTPLEQYGGDTGHTEPRSDLFSLGATLYHLLTGHPPVEAKERFLRPDALVPPRNYNPDLPPHIEAGVLWALSLHPDDRPSNAEQMREAFHPDAADRLLSLPSVGRRLWASAATPDRALAALAAGLALLAMIASLS